MHKTMMDATDVAQALGISKSHAYKIVRELNRDLKNAGYIVIAGKIPKLTGSRNSMAEAIMLLKEG